MRKPLSQVPFPSHWSLYIGFYQHCTQAPALIITAYTPKQQWHQSSTAWDISMLPNRYANSFCVQRFDKLGCVRTVSVKRSAATNLYLSLSTPPPTKQLDSSVCLLPPEIFKLLQQQSQQQRHQYWERANTVLKWQYMQLIELIASCKWVTLWEKEALCVWCGIGSTKLAAEALTLPLIRVFKYLMQQDKEESLLNGMECLEENLLAPVWCHLTALKQPCCYSPAPRQSPFITALKCFSVMLHFTLITPPMEGKAGKKEGKKERKK